MRNQTLTSIENYGVSLTDRGAVGFVRVVPAVIGTVAHSPQRDARKTISSHRNCPSPHSTINNYVFSHLITTMLSNLMATLRGWTVTFVGAVGTIAGPVAPPTEWQAAVLRFAFEFTFGTLTTR